MRRPVIAVLMAVVLTACGNSAKTAKNPEPTVSAAPQVHRVKVGGIIVLTGADDASGPGNLRIAVKVKNIVPNAVGRGAFEKPRKGERFAAVRFVFKNIGATPYQDSPTFGAKLLDTGGHGYDPTVATVSAGPAFDRIVNLPHGRVRSGFIVFAIPKTARVACVQYALNAGYAPEVGEWDAPSAGRR